MEFKGIKQKHTKMNIRGKRDTDIVDIQYKLVHSEITQFKDRIQWNKNILFEILIWIVKFICVLFIICLILKLKEMPIMFLIRRFIFGWTLIQKTIKCLSYYLKVKEPISNYFYIKVSINITYRMKMKKIV